MSLSWRDLFKKGFDFMMYNNDDNYALFLDKWSKLN